MVMGLETPSRTGVSRRAGEVAYVVVETDTRPYDIHRGTAKLSHRTELDVCPAGTGDPDFVREQTGGFLAA
jgi:hypothetical protein